MTPEEIEEFKSLNAHNANIYELMHKPEKIEFLEARHEKKFIKVANKVITTYLKRPGINQITQIYSYFISQ